MLFLVITFSGRGSDPAFLPAGTTDHQDSAHSCHRLPGPLTFPLGLSTRLAWVREGQGSAAVMTVRLVPLVWVTCESASQFTRLC